MPGRYSLIEVFTRESARHGGRPLHEALVDFIHRQRIAARCLAVRAVAGAFETGEVATQGILDLSHDMPVKVEILLPTAEAERVLPTIEEMVSEGIVTSREVEVRSYRTTHHLLPPQLRVRDAMTSDPRRISTDTPAGEVVRLLLGAEFNAAPVVDAAGRPVGIITQGDLVARAGLPLRPALLMVVAGEEADSLLRSLPPRRAGEIMSSPVVTIREDRPLSEAVERMLQDRFKRLPVVDADGRLVGVLARVDLFRAIAEQSPHWQGLARHSVRIEGVRSVRDVMQRDTHTVRADAPIEEVVRTIDRDDIQRVAVVDEGGGLLGIISDRDLLATLSDHRRGFWDYLVGKVGLGPSAQWRREVVKSARARTAGDVMRPGAITVREDAPLEEAVQLMVEHRLKRLPVVDAAGRFQGMISRDALLRAGWKRL